MAKVQKQKESPRGWGLLLIRERTKLFYATQDVDALAKACIFHCLLHVRYIVFDDFDKADIRVATVLECTNVKKSDRLLQFKLDDGMGGRTILSGIAQSYPDPSVLVGKQVLFIANFEPRKIMGIESQGMILSAVDADGSLAVTSLLREVKPGSQVG